MQQHLNQRVLDAVPRAAMVAIMFAAAFAAPWTTVAQNPAPDSREAENATVDPLSTKQQMIRERFKRFEDRVFRLREKLEEIEPENAQRLGRVLEQTGEFELEDRLNQIIELLARDGTRLDAVDAQNAWLEDAERVLGILLERDGENEERKDEIAKLEEFKKRLDQLLQEQKGLKNASSQATLQKRMAQQLEQAIKRIDALKKAQNDLKEDDDPKARKEKQDAVAKQAKDLADDLKQLSAGTPNEEADSESLETAKQASAKAAAATAESSQSMSEAGEQMSKDEEKSEEQQQQAVEKLDEAKEELEKALEALKEKSETSKMAGQQGALSQQTKGLADEMRSGASAPKGQQGSQAGKPGEPTPGTEKLDEAGQKMDGATQDLEEQNPEDASDKQQEAVDKLLDAQRELEEALNQLRKEEREETLRDLEARFRDMLARQKIINEETVKIDELELEAFTRAEQLRLAELSTSQRSLAQDATTCLQILDEDGTTIVFPRILDQLSEDMEHVANRLGEQKVGTLTQQIEREILETLEQLLESVQEMQRQNEQGQSGNQMAMEQEEQLLPESAELKLLRASQFRVNQRTEAIAELLGKETTTPKAIDSEFDTTAQRQVELAEVAAEIRERKDQR